MKITTIFTDIGGVLLTNGWDHNSRRAAADKFKLDFDEMESRHQLTFGTYEEGKIDLHTYVERIVFNKKRSFSPHDFENFMFEQSKPFEEMIKLLTNLKKKHQLKVVAVSNEGKELTEYRIKTFKLDSFIDFFISSCFVHLKKPDLDIYKLAIDASQTSPVQTVFIDDRPLFVEVARTVGLKGIIHTDVNSTKAELAKLRVN